MNFFEHQERARAQTRWMVWAFAFSLLLTVLLVVGVLAVAMASGGAKRMDFADATLPHLPALIFTGLGVAAVMGFASLYKVARLRAGGGVVAASLGGVPVPPDTREPRLRRLRNVVEEIAIASGVPVPAIYVLEREGGINAFAAGYAPADAAVAVTRGALEKLTRDELQGVIAHEFSHILNGDMRLNIRLMGLVFGLLVIHIVGREILANTPRGEKKGPTIAVLGLGLMIAGGIGLVFGRLIKARIARQREYLADASAVQFTRQTLGIGGALKKIAGIDTGSTLEAKGSEEVSHMLFGDGVGLGWLFATHPPVVDRIQRLEPQFKLENLKTQMQEWNEPGFYTDAGDESPVKFLDAASAQPLNSGAVVAQMGRPGADDYRYAESLQATLPLDIRAMAESDAGAPLLMLALLLDTDSGITETQYGLIKDALGSLAVPAVRHCSRLLENLHAAQRLPLAALAFPTLRRRPAVELEKLRALMTALARADGRIGAFEFVLARMLSVQLADVLKPSAAATTGQLRLDEAQDDIALLLAVLADAGTANAEAARHAFATGWNHLFPRVARSPALSATWPDALDAALDRLDSLRGLGKQMLVEALVKTLSDDGRVTVGEAELLRVTCASLHCPLPPKLSS